MPYVNDPSGLGVSWVDAPNAPVYSTPGETAAPSHTAWTPELAAQIQYPTGQQGMEDGDTSRATWLSQIMGQAAPAQQLSQRPPTPIPQYLQPPPAPHRDPSQRTTLWPGAGVGQLTLRNAETGEIQVVDSGDHTEVDRLTRSGWVPLNGQGQPYTVLDFKGGQMFFDPATGDASPLNVLLGGNWSDEQRAAMPEFQETEGYKRAHQSWEHWYGPSGQGQGRGTGPTGGGVPGPGGGPGGGGGTGPGAFTGNFQPRQPYNFQPGQIPNDWQDILKFLAQSGLNRSESANQLINQAGGQLAGAQQRVGSIDSRLPAIDQFIDSMMKQTEAANTWRNDLGNQIMFRQPFTDPVTGQPSLTPGLLDTAREFLGRANEAPGFSPEGKAALSQQLNKQIPQQFDEAIQSAYTELARRGALGDELPGSQADLTRVLAPIYAARSAAYSDANSQGILAQEQLKNQQLQMNRGLASNALGMLSGLYGTVGNMYDPAKYAQSVLGGFGQAGNLIGQGTEALNAGTGAVNAATSAYQAGNQPFGSAVTAGGALAENQPTSWKNLLLSSLFSTGLGALGGSTGGGGGGIDWGKIFGTIFGGGGSTPGTGIPGGPDVNTFTPNSNTQNWLSGLSPAMRGAFGF